MASEKGDESWTDGFKVAYRNHLNFYADEKDAVDVERDRQRILALVNTLLIASEAGAGPVG